MLDATQAAERRDDIHEFQKLYHDWLVARAACEDPSSWTDEEMTARAQKLDEAEMALLAMPAPNRSCFYEKWEVVERLVASEEVDGKLTNNRASVALSCVKADILRFGLSATD